MASVLIHVEKALLLNSNDRLHYMAKANRTAALRLRAYAIASRDGIRVVPPVNITATVTYPPRSRRREAINLAPTTKALIDGIVDAGIIPDDNDDVVHQVTHRSGHDKGTTGVWSFRLDIEAVA
jgi:crossover junction endodeoxyribonuclease RusA